MEIFTREVFLKKIDQTTVWDIIIIGGGATGLGAALDAASRGYKTILLEQSDFARGTSSRSTKLVHGGVRYLAQGNIALVYEALRERGLLLKNAPHVVRNQAFIIPCYSLIPVLKYLAGLQLYDWMAGRFRFGKSSFLSKQKVLKALPQLVSKDLKGGIQYYDGQFDDARLAINLAQTAAENGGVLLNYMQVKSLQKDEGNKINAVTAVDQLTGEEYHLRCKAVINATGVFVDEILNMDEPARKPLVRPSQGVHIVLNKSFFDGEKALMIPKTADGRVLFAVPWHGHILVGTTDTPIRDYSLEPQALDQEIDFILQTAAKYLTVKPTRSDVLSVFAGLRPLAATDNAVSTKEISRSHKIFISDSGLITVTGGKWTTYRKMAEDIIDKAIQSAGLTKVACTTPHIKIHGFIDNVTGKDQITIYGSDQTHIDNLVNKNPELGKKLHEHLPYIGAEVVWAVQNEMAITVQDVLARRLRALFLDAKAAIDMAPQVAAIMAKHTGKDEAWQQGEVTAFVKLANQYLLQPYPFLK